MKNTEISKSTLLENFIDDLQTPLEIGDPDEELMVGDVVTPLGTNQIIDLDSDHGTTNNSNYSGLTGEVIDTIYNNLSGDVKEEIDDIINSLSSGDVVPASKLAKAKKKAIAPFAKGGSKSMIPVNNKRSIKLPPAVRASLEKIFDATPRDLRYPLLSCTKGSLIWEDMGYFSKDRDYTSAELLAFSKMNTYFGKLFKSRRVTAVATNTGTVVLTGFSEPGEDLLFLAINLELSSTSFKNVADAKFKITATLGDGYTKTVKTLDSVWASFEQSPGSNKSETNFHFRGTIIPYNQREDGGKMSTLGLSSDATPLSITIQGLAEGTSVTARILGPEAYLV